MWNRHFSRGWGKKQTRTGIPRDTYLLTPAAHPIPSLPAMADHHHHSPCSHPLGRGCCALERVQQCCLQVLEVGADKGLAGSVGSGTHLLQHTICLLLHAALFALQGQPTCSHCQGSPSHWCLKGHQHPTPLSRDLSPMAAVQSLECGSKLAASRRYLTAAPAPHGWRPAHLEGRLDGSVQGVQGLLISIGCHCHYQVQDGESAAEDTQLHLLTVALHSN